MLNKLILALLPKKKILGYIFSALIGAAAMFAGISAQELKEEIAKQEPVNIQKAVDESKAQDAKNPK